MLIAAVSAAAVLASAGTAAAAAPPQGYQSDAQFAASYVANSVTNVSATTQRTSCYAPEVEYLDGAGYPGYADGGGSPCNGAVNTGEDVGPFPQQNVKNDVLLVKDHSESDIRVDPTNSLHLIGQSKWFVNGQGYNHLLGFYESFDGGSTWKLQGHVPGYEGWTDNTDPIGAFDPWGNFYSLILPYQFYYKKDGSHGYSNGANLPNPSLPGEAISNAVHPATLGKQSVTNWLTNDYLYTVTQAVTHGPDKQWITIDTHRSSRFFGRAYAMFVIYDSFNGDHPFVSHADTTRDGTHTPWTTPYQIPSISGHPYDQYLQPHVDPSGTVWTTSTLAYPKQGYSVADVTLTWSTDGGDTWHDALPVLKGVTVPAFQNTTFREGAEDAFTVGQTKLDRVHYPLYLAYEDGSSGMSHVNFIWSVDGGSSWQGPIQVDDGNPSDGSAGEAMQPAITVAPDGTVGVAFYDRRLTCPTSDSSEAAGSGIVWDPGTSTSPGTPWGRADYCINTAIQFYTPSGKPIGHNIRLSAHTWDPQLSTARPSSINSSGGFIGDYFGLDSSLTGLMYTTSVSTFDYGANPGFHQQQIVAKVTAP
jgi:hypothetical protein